MPDYLTAIRAKKANLTIDEAVYIIKSVVNALIAFRSTAGVIQKCIFGKSKSAQGIYSCQWKDKYTWVLCYSLRVLSSKIRTMRKLPLTRKKVSEILIERPPILLVPLKGPAEEYFPWTYRISILPSVFEISPIFRMYWIKYVSRCLR